jgi:acyl-CoA synthetase (AMP-forming)/AMP-acid ligase II
MPLSHPQTLLDLLDQRDAFTPQQAAFYWDDQPFSFEALWRGANRFAVLLLKLGVARGDRILIRLGNGPDFFQAFYGTLRAGAIAVPLFPASGPERVAALAQLCGASILVVPGLGSEEIPGLRTVCLADSAPCPVQGAFPAVAPDDVAFLQYTSGSTGTPKGVMLSHESLLTNIGQLIEGMALTPSDCFVSWLPVYHDMGLIFMTMVPFYLGAKLVLRHRAPPRHGHGGAGLRVPSRAASRARTGRLRPLQPAPGAQRRRARAPEHSREFRARVRPA